MEVFRRLTSKKHENRKHSYVETKTKYFSTMWQSGLSYPSSVTPAMLCFLPSPRPTSYSCSDCDGAGDTANFTWETIPHTSHSLTSSTPRHFRNTLQKTPENKARTVTLTTAFERHHVYSRQTTDTHSSKLTLNLEIKNYFFILFLI
jgi:hypothetical protein